MDQVKIVTEKAVKACLAAITVYNNPNLQYREESFAILMINAWELLLKARILKNKNGDLRSIQRMERTSVDDFNGGNQEAPRKTKSGNMMTIGLNKGTEIVRHYVVDGINSTCIANLKLLQEIRDNAIHFTNEDNSINHKVYEIGSAALQNFVLSTQKWFQIDFDQFNIFPMPLAFSPLSGIVESIGDSGSSENVNRFLKLVSEEEVNSSSRDVEDYNVTLKIIVKFVRDDGSDVSNVKVEPSDPGATKIRLSEEKLKEKYPWDFKQLVEKLKSRYTDFKQNSEFYSIKRELEENSNLCHKRFLDRNQRGTSKKYYSSSISRNFDQHYSRNQLK